MSQRMLVTSTMQERHKNDSMETRAADHFTPRTEPLRRPRSYQIIAYCIHDALIVAIITTKDVHANDINRLKADVCKESSVVAKFN